MKNRSIVVLVASACISLASLVANAQITIMPFGDSVTSRGSSPESSYRYWLYVDLTNAGYDPGSFTFVGSQSGVSDGTPANFWPDQAYEGGDGLTTGAALAADEGDAVGQGPNIVLLDLGANDIFGNEGQPVKTTLAQTETNLEMIIQGFVDNNPNTVIILARPTGWVTVVPIEKQFMSQLGGAISKVASAERKAGVNVVTVNLSGGFNVHTDTDDGTHPNVKGEQQIARKFFNALSPQLKKMGVIPTRSNKH